MNQRKRNRLYLGSKDAALCVQRRFAAATASLSAKESGINEDDEQKDIGAVVLLTYEVREI